MSRSDVLPLVSIITPVYNGAAFIEELILSVQRQDYPNIEHIIIDDGSQDDGATIAILKRYPHLRWWSRENKGQYASMNEGLEAAKGEFVCFISADDLLAPGAVKIAIKHLMQHPELDGLYGRALIIDIDRNPHWKQVSFQGLPFKLYPYLTHVFHCSLYINAKQLINEGLRFNTGYRYNGDYDWIILLMNSGLNIGFLDTVLSQVRYHKNQTSNKYPDAMIKEHNTILRKYHYDTLQHRFFLALLQFLRYLDTPKLAYQSKGIQGVMTMVTDWFSRKIIKRR